MKVDTKSWREVKSGVFLRKELTDICPSGDLQITGNELIMRVARKAKMPLLMTLDSHFIKNEQKIIQDLALQNGKEEGEGLKFSTSYCMLSTEEAWRNWESIHGNCIETEKRFEEAVENNERLASQCSPIVFDKEFHLPEISIPYEIRSTVDSKEEALSIYVNSLIERYGRYRDTPEYKDRLAIEMNVVRNNGKIDFMPYFLTLHDVCAVARSIGVVVGVGRGSAGGSLLAYLLNITHMNPLEYDMPFERFLSQGRIDRGKFPDIDMDFSDPERLAKSLKEIYDDKMVRVCTTGTNKVRSAIKDVARVCLDTKNNKDEKIRIDALCKTISLVPPNVSDLNKWLDGYDDDNGHVYGELEINGELRHFFDSHVEMANLIRSVLGIPKSIGRHAAAYCIADQPVHQLVPVCRIKGEICTQFTMGPVEELGLVKFDMLGLNTLNDISGCVKLIKSRHNIDINIYDVPKDDKDVYTEFANGHTETVFQYSGSVPTNISKLIKPQSIQDLAAITAACRPGTMYAEIEDGNDMTTFIDLWVQRHTNKRPTNYLHPSLEPILRSTHGIFIFQEQINKMFVECCGYSPEKADEMREVIGKKKLEKMNQLLPDIKERLRQRGWGKTQIDSIVSLCIAASSYSFNLSHAIFYAYSGYLCMWLKYHYTLEWWTSVLQNSTHEDLEKNAEFFVKYLRSPDVNKSDVDFYIIDEQEEKIVYPLSMIKGIKNAAKEIVMHKPFTSLEEFFHKVNKRLVNKKVVNAMIWTGAFDKMPEATGETPWSKRNALAIKYAELRKCIPPEPLPKGIVLRMESAYLCIGEPDIQVLYKERYPNSPVLPIDQIAKMGDRKKAATIGTIKEVRVIKTKKKEDMCFVSLGNAEFTTSVTFFPKTYQAYKDDLIEGAILRVAGETNTYKDVTSLVANSATFYEISDL